jgi:hypothetical protein
MADSVNAHNLASSTDFYDGDTPKIGRHAGVPEADYFAMPATNASTLKHMGRSALHCKAEMSRSGDRPDTEAQKVGRLIHCAVLEPERFADDYVREPTHEEYPDALVSLEDYKAQAKALGLKVGGTKDQLKARIQEHLLDAQAELLDGRSEESLNQEEMAFFLDAIDKLGDPDGIFFDDIHRQLTFRKTPLKADHWFLAQSVLESIAASSKAAKALSGGVAEETMVWRDELTGLLCKSRLDYYREDLGVIFDVKTTEDARPEAVMRDIHKWGYHVSAAHYLAGLEALDLNGGQTFAWVFVEKKAPYAIGLYFASAEMIDRGREQRRQYLSDFARCKLSGIWPSYPGEFQTIDLPSWA